MKFCQRGKEGNPLHVGSDYCTLEMTIHRLSLSRSFAIPRPRPGLGLSGLSGRSLGLGRISLEQRLVLMRAGLQAKGREIDMRELQLSPSARPLGEGSFGTVYQVRAFEIESRHSYPRWSMVVHAGSRWSTVVVGRRMVVEVGKSGPLMRECGPVVCVGASFARGKRIDWWPSPGRNLRIIEVPETVKGAMKFLVANFLRLWIIRGHWMIYLL